MSCIIQMNNLAIEQDIYNLKRDCEDKDAIIKELTTLLHSSDMAGSKVLFLSNSYPTGKLFYRAFFSSFFFFVPFSSSDL